jgi:hypothetical protein
VPSGSRRGPPRNSGHFPRRAKGAIAGQARPPDHVIGVQSAQPEPPASRSTDSQRSCDSDDMEALRWSVGDATIFRIGELDATAALQDLIPNLILLRSLGRAG